MATTTNGLPLMTEGQANKHTTFNEAMALLDAGVTAERLLSTTAGVNLNVTTKTALYTVPAGKTAIITRVVVRNPSVSLTTASFGFGFNANADDAIASETWTELTGSTLYTQRLVKDGTVRGAAGDVFGVKCSVAQGSAATATVHVFGLLV